MSEAQLRWVAVASLLDCSYHRPRADHIQTMSFLRFIGISGPAWVQMKRQARSVMKWTAIAVPFLLSRNPPSGARPR